MRRALLNLGRMAALAALGATMASAQDAGFGAELKLRAGLGLSSPDDHLTRQVYGFGFNLGYGTPVGRFSVELGWQYKPGNKWLNDVTKMQILPSTEIAPDPAQSSDLRKNTMEGMTVRFAYEKDLTDTFGVHGGIQLGGAKFKHEYAANVGDGVLLGNWNYIDIYLGTPVKSPKLTDTISPFVGVHYNINKLHAVELNLTVLRYKSIFYNHVIDHTGTPSATGIWSPGPLDKLQEKSHTVPHLEIGYTFRF